MKCPKCKQEGNNASFGTLDGYRIFIKMMCKNGHYFGRVRVMTDMELKKLRPFKSFDDIKYKIFK